MVVLDVWFFSNKTFDKVSVLTSFAQSWSVLVLTFMKSLSLDKSWSWHLWNFPVLMSLSLNIYKNFQSQWVLVSTSVKFPSLDESRSRHLENFSVSMSLGLDKFSDISLEPKWLVSSFIVSRTFVLVKIILWSWPRSWLWDSDLFSLGLDLVIETQTFSVLVLVSPLRIRPFQIQSQSGHWNSDLFSLGLVIEEIGVELTFIGEKSER